MDMPNLTSKVQPVETLSHTQSADVTTARSERYGWLCAHPACLQRFATPAWVCAALTASNIFMSGTYNGLSGAAQTSIETRFGLSSTQSSWIFIAYELGIMVSGLFVALVGSRESCNKPRWIACGLGVGAVGCVLYALPHVLSGVYRPEGRLDELDLTCGGAAGNGSDYCDDYGVYSIADTAGTSGYAAVGGGYADNNPAGYADAYFDGYADGYADGGRGWEREGLKFNIQHSTDGREIVGGREREIVWETGDAAMTRAQQGRDIVDWNGLGVSKMGTQQQGTGEKDYLWLFILAQVLLAFGSAPLYTLGLAYLDDCGNKEQFSFYSGIFCCGWIVGPALGFIGGGFALTLHTNFPVVPEDEWLDPDDPRWVGAWWLGFLVAALGLTLIAFPMAGFPHDLPGAREARLEKTSEAYDSVQNENQVNEEREADFSSQDILPYLKYLFTNWTWIFLSLFVACDIAIMTGYTVFGPKIIEAQFNFTPGQAAALLGILVVPSAIIGTISGGFVVRRFKLTLIQIMKVQLLLSVVVMVCGVCSALFCPDVDFAGINTPYYDQESSGDRGEVYNLTSTCNLHCDCGQIPFSPVCNTVDEVQYYSPCHAGCTDQDAEGDFYYNCSCSALSNTTDSSTVENSICTTTSCSAVIVFSVLVFFTMIAIFMTASMNISGIIRCVPRTHRLLGLVIHGIIQKTTGSIPAPILFGVIFDASCILWDNTCGQEGACYYFNKVQLGLSIYALCLIYKLLSIVFLLAAWKLYRPPKAPQDMVYEIGQEEGGLTGSKVDMGLAETKVAPGEVKDNVKLAEQGSKRALGEEGSQGMGKGDIGGSSVGNKYVGNGKSQGLTVVGSDAPVVSGVCVLCGWTHPADQKCSTMNGVDNPLVTKL